MPHNKKTFLKKYFDVRNGKQSGFTLVEMLLVLAVFVALTSIVLGRYRTFDTNAKFANASEDLVLAIRQAQVYGVGVRAGASPCGTGSAFDCAYGVYVTTTAGSNSSVTLFSDNNDNKRYDPGEEIPTEKISWPSNIAVTTATCAGCLTPGVLSITFKRPSPDAYINDNTASPASSQSSATITVTDANTGKQSTVTVTNAGQISLK